MMHLMTLVTLAAQTSTCLSMEYLRTSIDLTLRREAKQMLRPPPHEDVLRDLSESLLHIVCAS